jgi:hypothetical protein
MLLTSTRFIPPSGGFVSFASPTEMTSASRFLHLSHAFIDDVFPGTLLSKDTHFEMPPRVITSLDPAACPQATGEM